MASSVKNYQCPSCTDPSDSMRKQGCSYASDAIEALYGVRTEPEASAEKADMGSKEGGSPWSLARTGGSTMRKSRRCDHAVAPRAGPSSFAIMRP